MFPDKEIMCHHTGFTMSCLKGVTEQKCQKWMLVMGMDPQTGHDFNRYGCADSMVPVLLIENSQMQRQTGAAVESLRNEMVALSHGTPPLAFDVKKIGAVR